MIARADISPRVALRMQRLRRLIAVTAIGLLAYLFDMQVLRRHEFEAAAAVNSLRRVPLRAPRGLLLDRDGRVLVKNRPAFDAVVRADRVRSAPATLARAGQALGLGSDELRRLGRLLRDAATPEVVFKEDLSLAEVARIEARAHEWPEFRIRETLVRSYPHGSAAAHVFGHMGEIRDSQLEEPRFRGYPAGAVVGQTGIEARYEAYLRGVDGARRVVVNSRGREIRVLEQVEPPQPGLDLRLSLDLDVQLAAEAAFGERRGAAVAVDSRTGEVLALVSRPAFDPNAFAGKLTGEAWRRFNTDPAHPMFDRALLGRLPPGSVFKVVDAIAGLEERVWDPDDPVVCNGRTVVHGDVFRCWRPEGHGRVAFHEAMRGSCNVYFYHRGDAVGIDGLARWAHRLGLGERTGIDLEGEGRGIVPDPAWKRRTLGQPWWPGETVSVAIGQGALGVSVLQLATMVQVVANGGTAWVPHLVTAVGSGEVTRAPEVLRRVELRSSTLDRVRRGLRAVVNEPGGTGGRARIPGFDVSGKTGTAQTPPSSDDPADAREHAWFVGYAPGTDPVAVVAVFVEHGGHGGEAAAPIARVMLERILEKQGLKPSGTAPVLVAGMVGTRFIGPPSPDQARARLARPVEPPGAVGAVAPAGTGAVARARSGLETGAAALATGVVPVAATGR